MKAFGFGMPHQWGYLLECGAVIPTAAFVVGALCSDDESAHGWSLDMERDCAPTRTHRPLPPGDWRQGDPSGL